MLSEAENQKIKTADTATSLHWSELDLMVATIMEVFQKEAD